MACEDLRHVCGACGFKWPDRSAYDELTLMNANLRECLASLLPQHCGACCTFDEAHGVVITEESCVCGPVEKRARIALLGPGWRFEQR